MSRHLFLVGLCLVATASMAQQDWKSLHRAPIGTEVEGSFVLARKVFPLPPGKFTLAAGNEEPSREMGAFGVRTATPSPMADVILVQTQGSILRAVVWARANTLVASLRWVAEPCKRTDTLFMLDRTKSFNYRHDCVLVNHETNWFANSKGKWESVRDSLKLRGVDLPIPTMLSATVTRVVETQYMFISYYFNPIAYGFPPEATSVWKESSWHKSRVEADPSKSAFAKALVDWAVALKPVIDQGFSENAFVQSAIPELRLPILDGATTVGTQPAVAPAISPLPIESKRLSLEASETKCAELGFKPRTEDYGKCVLQLSK